MKRTRTRMNQAIERSPDEGMMSMILRGLGGWSSFTRGLRPSDSPARALARRFDGSLRSRGAAARSLATLCSEALPVDERVEGFGDVTRRDDFARIGRVFRSAVPVRDDTAGEAHLRRFTHAERRLTHAADFTSQADLTEHSGGRFHWAVAHA